MPKAKTVVGAAAAALAILTAAGASAAPAGRALPAPSGVIEAKPFAGGALADAAPARLAPGVHAGRTGGGAILGPVHVFEGISNAENAAVGAGTAAKPDPVGDVGPRHYVQMVNYSIAVYSKTGERLLGPLPGNRIWRGLGNLCETTNRGDPIVLYDELADRWVLTQFAWSRDVRGLPAPPFLQCVAVSRTPDPTADYVRYAFRLPGGSLPDYPKLALWPTAYVLLTYPDLARDGRARPRLFGLDRAAMLRGDTATAIEFTLERALGRALPVDLDGAAPPAGEPAYVVRVAEAPPRVELWALTLDFGAPEESSLELRAAIPVDDFDPVLCAGAGSFCIRQPETASRLDDLARRLMFRAAYRRLASDAAIVLNHTVDADGAGRAGIRWYEVRGIGSTPHLRQKATYAPDDADSRWTGSIALDRTGGIGLGFSVSGPETYPSVAYTGRLADDPLGEMTHGEGRLATGTASQIGAGGWGDYSNLVTDPVDGCTFWYTQSYYRTAGRSSWRTTIGSFRLIGCDGVPAIEGTAFEGQTLLVADGPWIAVGSGFRYRRCTPGGASCRDIDGATAREYSVSDRDVGSTLRALIDVPTERGDVSWLSQPTSIVGGAPRDVVVTMTASRARVRAGRAVRFAVEAGNHGEGNATGIAVSLALPRGAHAGSVAADGGSCTVDGAAVCTFDVLAPGASATMRAEVRFDDAGPARVTARAAADQPDADAATNDATALIAVEPLPIVQIRGRPLRARVSGATALVSGRIERSETMRVSVALERNGRRVDLRPGSTLGGRTLRTTAKDVRTIGAAAAPLSFRLVVRSPRPDRRSPLTFVVTGRAADLAQARSTAPVTWAKARRSR